MSDELEKTLPQLKVKLPSGKVLNVPVSSQKQQDAVDRAMAASEESGTSVISAIQTQLIDTLSQQASQVVASDAVSSSPNVTAENQERLESLLSNQLSLDNKLSSAMSRRVLAAFDAPEVVESVNAIEKYSVDIGSQEQLLNARIASVLPDAAATTNYQLPNMESLTLEDFRSELQKQGVSDAIIEGLLPEFNKVKLLQEMQVQSLDSLSTQILGKVSEQPVLELEQLLKPAMVEALKDPVVFSEKLDAEAERLAGLKPQANEAIQGDRPLDSKVEPKLDAAIDTGNVADKAAQVANKPAVESKAETAVEQAETFLRTSEGKFKAGKAAVLATAAAAVGGLAYAKLRSSPEEKPAAQTVDSGQVSLPALAMSRS